MLEVENFFAWEDQPDGSRWQATVEYVSADGWIVRVVFVEQKGAAVPRELSVRPADPEQIPLRGITRRNLVRALRFEDLLAEARQNAINFLDHNKKWIYGDMRRKLRRDILRALMKGELLLTQTTARRLEDLDYARLAVRYEEITRTNPRAPVAQLAEENFVTRVSMSNKLSRARDRKLLTEVPKGQLSAATAKAHELVSRADADTLAGDLSAEAPE
jgi:hypothetical protein